MGWFNFLFGKTSDDLGSTLSSKPRSTTAHRTSARPHGLNADALSAVKTRTRSNASPAPSKGVKTSQKTKLSSGTAKRPCTAEQELQSTAKAEPRPGSERASKTIVTPTGNRKSKTASGTEIIKTPNGRKLFKTKAKTPTGKKKTTYSYDASDMKTSARKKKRARKKSVRKSKA